MRLGVFARCSLLPFKIQNDSNSEFPNHSAPLPPPIALPSSLPPQVSGLIPQPFFIASGLRNSLPLHPISHIPYPIFLFPLRSQVSSFIPSSTPPASETLFLPLTHADGEVTARPAVTPYRFCWPLSRSSLNYFLSFIIQNLEFKISSRTATSRPTLIRS